ncbi:MAG: GldG family protein [Anaerolineales bacterium]|nr:GldG family protein [Anaerolineales bacterium]
MNATYKRFAPVALALGLAGLVFAAGAALIQRQFTVYVQASLVVGLLGLALAMLLNPAAVQVWLQGRQARYGGNVAVMAVALLGILILINYLSVRNPLRWDWSEGQQNTLAPETLEALKQLPQPVQAVAFYSTSFANARQTAETLLEQYRVASAGQFTYAFHDPVGEPTVARQYDVTRDGTVVIVMGDQHEEVQFATEDQVTGALIRLAHPTSRTIYFLTGHGEHAIDSTEDAGLSRVADLLKRQNYTLLPLNLAITSTVPADARAIVIAGPSVPVTPAEVDVIQGYTDRGGALIVLLDSRIQFQGDLTAPEPLADYLAAAWSVQAPNDVIIDFSNGITNQPLFPTDFAYGDSVITSRLQGIKTVFPVARGLIIPAEGTALPNLTFTSLVQAAPDAWGETNFDSLNTNPAFDAADNPPPLNLGVAVENTATKARLVVFGDSDFASNAFADQGANANLLANSVNWATVEETLINLTPKTPTTRTLALSNALTVNVIFFVVVVILPLAVLVLGGVVWFQRRRHV